MIDEFPPPGWFLQPENWPYWMPSTLLGALPPSAFPSDPSAPFGAHERQPLLGANSGIMAPSNAGLNDAEPAWLSSVRPPATEGGLLGFLIRSNDPENQDASVWSRLATSSAANGGLLSQLARPNSSASRSAPAWPQPLLPFGADAVGLKPPVQPSGLPRESGSSSWPANNVGIDHGWLGSIDANRQSPIGPISTNASSLETANTFEQRGPSNDELDWSGRLPSLGRVLGSILGISSAGAAELRDPVRIGRPELLEGGGPRGSGGSTGGSGWFGATPTVAKRPATAADQLAVNRAAGLRFEQLTNQELRRSKLAVSPQITLQTQSGARTRVDFLGRDAKTSEILCIECKASNAARLTPFQRRAFPEIEQSGATVVGAGKPDFPGGTVIPPTRVKIFRP
jgi:hypothetical protein